MYIHCRCLCSLHVQSTLSTPLELLGFLCMSSGTPQISVPLSTSVGLGLGKSPQPLGSECSDSRAPSRPDEGFFIFLILTPEPLDTLLLWLSYLHAKRKPMHSKYSSHAVVQLVNRAYSHSMQNWQEACRVIPLLLNT